MSLGNSPEQRLRQEIVFVGQTLYAKGFVGATDGNISARLSEDLVLVTPSGISKGFLEPRHLLVSDLQGRIIFSATDGDRTLRASSEFPLHLEAYRQRPDVMAVVHAHPPVAIACSIAGISMETPVIPEVVVSLGGVPTTPYVTPGTAEGAEAIRGPIQSHDAIILDHHGVVTVAATVTEAYLKLEKVEHAAGILLAAAQLGKITPLTPEQVTKLVDIRRKLGLLQPGDEKRLRQHAEKAEKEGPAGLEALIRQVVAEELAKRSGQGDGH